MSMVETRRHEINSGLLKFCYEPATRGASSKGIFAAATNRQTSQVVHAINQSIFYMMSIVETHRQEINSRLLKF